MIVLDTNVVSELLRRSPAPVVLSWLRGQRTGTLFTSAITVAEVTYGIARLPTGRRRSDLDAAAQDVFGAFPAQVLPFDAAAAGRYTGVVADLERNGNPIVGFDAQIAAICLVHSARLATRNVKDFLATGVELIDPWRQS